MVNFGELFGELLAFKKGIFGDHFRIKWLNLLGRVSAF